MGDFKLDGEVGVVMGGLRVVMGCLGEVRT